MGFRKNGSVIMAKVNPQKLTTEEFQEQQAWIGKLFSILNQFIEQAVAAFANSLTIEDNLYQEIREIKWTNTPTNFPLKFQTKFKTNPKGLVPIYLLDTTLGSYSTAQPWVVWGYANGLVTMSDISGLISGHSYTVRLQVIYG